jgi:hypothetical protein
VHRAPGPIAKRPVEVADIALTARDAEKCCRRAVKSCLALLAAAASASADPLVLDDHQVAALLSLEINLGSQELGHPLALAPDVWWGATPRWTVGLIHSNTSLDRIEAGASLCVRDAVPECDGVYHNFGVDVRWNASSIPASAVGVLAPRVRFLVRTFNPVKPALTLGALARWTRGRLSIAGDPYVQLGLANRDRGNRTELILPVWCGVEPAAGWSVAVQIARCDRQADAWVRGACSRVSKNRSCGQSCFARLSCQSLRASNTVAPE